MTLPSTLIPRITNYVSGAEWRRDAQYGAPLYCVSATTTAAVLGAGTSTLPGPWSVWSRARDWDGEAAGNLWAAEEAAGELDDGLTWEPFMLQWAASKFGYDLLEVAGGAPFRVRHPTLPWARVSPDGLVRCLETDEFGVADPKAPYGFADWGEDGEEVPKASKAALRLFPADRGPKHLMQAYWTLACIPEAAFFDFLVGLHFRDVRRIRVWRDESYQKTLVHRVASWRERHLVKGKPPEYDESIECLRHVKRLPRDGTREADDDERALIIRYREAQAAKTGAESEMARVQLELADSMGPVKKLTVETGVGKPATYSIAKNGAVNVRRLEDIEA